MTLRTKTLGIIGLICVTLIVVTYIISSTLLLNDFSKLEAKDVRENVAQARDAVTESLTSINAYAGDYSKWDDTYAFIQNRNETYIKANMVNPTFVKLRLDLIMFINTSGKIVYAKAVEWRKGKDIPVAQSILDHFSKQGPLTRHQSLDSNPKGILLLPEGPLLVTSQPILTSEEKGPIRGALIFGRFLDDEEVKRLGKLTHLSVTIHLFNDSALPSDLVKAKRSLSASSPMAVLPMNNKTVSGYTVLPDVYGKPALLLKVEAPRSIYQQGLTSTHNLVLTLVLAALIFCAAILLILEKSVLSRIFRINRDIDAIGVTRDLSGRVSVRGRDELAKLAQTINSTLQALEQSQIKLKESEERYHAVVEQVSEVIILVDIDTKKIMEINPAFKRLWGYSEDEIGTLTLYDLEEHDRREIEANINRLITTHQAYTGERRAKHKDGRLIDVEFNANLISYGGRQVLCVVVRDITERKAAREALRRANDELEMRVLDRTLELAHANKSLQLEIAERKQTEVELRQTLGAAETARRAKSEFLANMSHELRTPMNGILGMTDLTLETDLTESQREYLNLVKESANSLLAIISDILDFSALEAHKLEIQTTLFEAPKHIGDTLNRLSERVREKGLEFHADLASNIPQTVMGDPDRLAQILNHLTGNAVKFTEAGEVRVEVSVDSLTPDKTELHFIVSDTGIGIPADKQQAIFEVFSQVDGSITRKYGGTGLGLTLSANTITILGGKIWVESPAPRIHSGSGGPGTAFHFIVPFALPASAPMDQADPEAEPSLSS